MRLFKKDSDRDENELRYKVFSVLSFLFLSFFLISCSANSNIKLRSSPYWGSPINWINPDSLGTYCYGGCIDEKIGMLYTKKGGFIDTGHLMESMDRTKCSYDVIRKNLILELSDFRFKLTEPATYAVHVGYPFDWRQKNKPEKEKIIDDVSIALGQVIAHRSTIWHESITWYGWSCMAIFPEKPSSFSWEDIYSDLLGSKIGAEALRTGGEFEVTANQVMRRRIEELSPVSIKEAKRAASTINGRWYSALFYPMIDMKKRNFDVGFNGYITPWLVPGFSTEDIQLCAAPSLDSASRAGFTFTVEVDPGSVQGRRLAMIAGKNRVELDDDLQTIVEYIRHKAVEEKGYEVDKPNARNSWYIRDI